MISNHLSNKWLDRSTQWLWSVPDTYNANLPPNKENQKCDKYWYLMWTKTGSVIRWNQLRIHSKCLGMFAWECFITIIKRNKNGTFNGFSSLSRKFDFCDIIFVRNINLLCFRDSGYLNSSECSFFPFFYDSGNRLGIWHVLPLIYNKKDDLKRFIMLYFKNITSVILIMQLTKDISTIYMIYSHHNEFCNRKS